MARTHYTPSEKEREAAFIAAVSDAKVVAMCRDLETTTDEREAARLVLNIEVTVSGLMRTKGMPARYARSMAYQFATNRAERVAAIKLAAMPSQGSA